MDEIQKEEAEDVRLILAKLIKGFNVDQRIYLARWLIATFGEH